MFALLSVQYKANRLLYLSAHLIFYLIICLSVYYLLFAVLVGAGLRSMRDTWCRAVYWGNLCLSYRFPILTQQFTAT